MVTAFAILAMFTIGISCVVDQNPCEKSSDLNIPLYTQRKLHANWEELLLKQSLEMT